jgi:phage-related protein
LYKVNFYRDKNGKQPVKEYLQELKNKGGKDSKIKFNKINDYIEVLSKYGTYAGEPYIKHLEGDIWELRPLSDRILFVA